MTVEPFKWELRTVSQQSIEATEALFSFLPATPARDAVVTELRKVLMQHLGNETYFLTEAVDVMPCRQWLTSVPDPSIVTVLGMTPLSSKVLIHIDHVIAHHVIDRLLGGSDEITPELRLLTDAEIGVLQYLIMQLLMRLHAVCGHDERIHFRFEQVLQRSENLLPLIPSKEDGVVVTVRLGFSDHVGFVRLLFPNPFVAEAFVKPLRLPSTAGEHRYWKSRIEAFGDLKASVWAEAGGVTIHPDELRNLEVGDVILLDESDVHLKNKTVEGDLKLRVGDGQHGWVQASVDADQEVLHCTIENIQVGG